MKANCRECGIIITNQKNIGQDRHVWPGPRTDYLCMNCFVEKGKRGSMEMLKRRLYGCE